MHSADHYTSTDDRRMETMTATLRKTTNTTRDGLFEWESYSYECNECPYSVHHADPSWVARQAAKHERLAAVLHRAPTATIEPDDMGVPLPESWR